MIHQKPNQKIDQESFENILKMIDFDMGADVKKQMINRLFVKKSEITFEEFLGVFKLDLENYTPVDIKNAFGVLAKDSDSHIDIKIIDDLVSELDIKEGEKKFLLNHLA
jgi:Ca2+-binding EF-hand superfamily protein